MPKEEKKRTKVAVKAPDTKRDSKAKQAAQYTSALLAGAVLGQYSPQLVPSVRSSTAKTEFSVCFSPKGGVADLVLRTLAKAKERIFVHAYAFTSPDIAQGLIAAHQRGVQVKVIVDKSQNVSRERKPLRKSQIGVLRDAGINVYVDRKVKISHNKIMLLDDDTVITGSYNWTENAELRNAENLLVVRNKSLLGRYLNNWEQRLASAEPMSQFVD